MKREGGDYERGSEFQRRLLIGLLLGRRAQELAVNQQKANTLKQNVLDQVPYTPEARQELENTPVLAAADKSGISGWYSPQDQSVAISNQALGDSSAGGVLTHEFNHALDVMGQRGAGYFPASSQGITNKTQYSSDIMNQLNEWLANYPASLMQGREQIGPDQEMFAQYGASPQRALLNSPNLAAYYKDVFIPMSKRMNYSPVYKVQ